VSERASREIDNNRSLFIDAFRAVWMGEAESDGFNRLVLEAGVPWRSVSVIRAYRKYQRQIGSMFSDAYVERCLANHADLVRLLMAIFDTRLNPERPGDRAADLWLLDMQIDSGLDDIESLDEDRILRAFRNLVMATLRTNFYQRTPDGSPKPALSLKLDPSAVPDMPLPRPMFEVFVYSPRVEGVHLRGAKVARGGLRWSDRREDFRTEILGLMKAQMVKNAVIVPSGAKGGFVVKQPPPPGDRDAAVAEGIACYRIFIGALLDITDNLVAGTVVAPVDVIRRDGDDPYLVVAADKGTATFSDIANEIALDAGFWLGDAFASGGSAGYDHKKMGITARGAWESVKRHFRELGVDTQATDFTVVGVGDMSGDVFGNGMLLSPHIRLVGAFDHRHVFLDPDPDAATSFAERQRLFHLPRSSWADYDPALISAGGGVFPRTAKSIPLSPEIRRVLHTDAEALTPDALVHALLLAPVDLFFNGGIGTYVKASTESHAEVGDKANDAVRVDGDQLRCRVVGEGGNLGCTQRGRVEYSLAGGRIYTDAIDNSAGVDCSDHEVNIKILLDAVERAGTIDHGERDALLVAMTDDVAASVLRDNFENTEALSVARAQAVSMAEVHGRYITDLGRAGELDRKVEFLPSAAELAERGATGHGLTSPEQAVLLAYTKVLLCDEILDSDLPEDPALAATLAEYFPPLVRERFPREIADHPLRREIIATSVSNLVVNRGGTSFLYRLADETQASKASLARCHLAAGLMFDVEPLWREIEALDNVVPAAQQTAMLLACRRLIERATRWLVKRRKDPIDIQETVDFFAGGIAALRAELPDLIVGDDRDRHASVVAELADHGVPVDLATRVASLEWLFSALDIVEISAETAHDLVAVAAVSFELVRRLHLDWLRDQIAQLPRDSRWHTQARASIRADLYERLRALTVSVILGQEHLDVPTASKLIDEWEARRDRRLERYQRVLADLNAGDTADLAVLSVALRAVHDLTDAER
jgi:glutamate dehydrogenase